MMNAYISAKKECEEHKLLTYLSSRNISTHDLTCTDDLAKLTCHILEKYLKNTSSWHISHFNPQTHKNRSRKTIVKWGHNRESFSVFQKQFIFSKSMRIALA